MTKARLERFTKLCLGLPEAVVEGERHKSFSVRGKKFAYWLDDHHGDGIVAACVKLGPGENEELVELDPKRFYLPAYIHAHGYVGVRVDRPGLDWDALAEMTLESYRRSAPKRLAASLTTEQPAPRARAGRAKRPSTRRSRT